MEEAKSTSAKLRSAHSEKDSLIEELEAKVAQFEDLKQKNEHSIMEL